jgi:hypothetical protein
VCNAGRSQAAGGSLKAEFGFAKMPTSRERIFRKILGCGTARA